MDNASLTKDPVTQDRSAENLVWFYRL